MRRLKLGSRVRCPKTKRRGEIVAKHAGGWTVRGTNGAYFTIKDEPVPVTEWGAEYGGDMNPELLALAAKVKA